MVIASNLQDRDAKYAELHPEYECRMDGLSSLEDDSIPVLNTAKRPHTCTFALLSRRFLRVVFEFESTLGCLMLRRLLTQQCCSPDSSCRRVVPTSTKVLVSMAIASAARVVCASAVDTYEVPAWA